MILNEESTPIASLAQSYCSSESLNSIGKLVTVETLGYVDFGFHLDHTLRN